MKVKNDAFGARKLKVSHVLLAIAALYLIFISLKLPQFLKIAAMIKGDDTFVGMGEINQEEFGNETFYRKIGNNQNPNSRSKEARLVPVRPHSFHYGRITGEVMQRINRTKGLSDLEVMAEEAWNLGLKAWEEVKAIAAIEGNESSIYEGQHETCPSGLSLTGEELKQPEYVMFLPCGLAAGSAITIIGTPHHAHEEFVPQLARYGYSDGVVLVSQFVVELQGLKSVVGEEPPKILHLNPRLKGDWGKRPVIEHNTCYRMQWGIAQRCNGLLSKDDDDILVDGYRRCERWTENDAIDSKESKTASWFKRFIGREQKPDVSWPFPFVEGRMFIMTIRAGIDGFHINVGGRHVSSFTYRMGFTLEDATGLVVKGNIDIHSIFSTSLPTSHPSFSPQRVLEMSPKWKSFPFLESIVQLFVGILSATNHFAERMAVRKTWMQSPAIKSSYVAVRFFVALNSRKEMNALLKKEAAYFGDIIILPFIDRYELVVLKTIAICEYGVHNTTAAYIMKCDDDTFMRVDNVLKEIGGVLPRRSLYMGNLNLLHRPLRTGKWAVSYEEWPAEIYPPYANGPAYVISNDIAKFIVSRHANRSLRIFKMEDVSMGMWVEQFNASSPVQYSHNWKFCQYGCMEGYYTAHYQSPRQMMCLWDNLARGHAHCCNSR